MDIGGEPPDKIKTCFLTGDSDTCLNMLSSCEKWLLCRGEDWNHQSQVLWPDTQKTKRPVILIHGFMGSPYDLRPLGLFLAENGFKAVIPVIPGQTWTTPPLRRKRYSASFYVAWLERIIACQTGQAGCRPFLVGFSMGGTLSTIVAARDRVKKLVLIAPFYKLPNFSDRIWHLSRKLSFVLPVVPKLSKGRINDRQGYRRYIPGSCLVSLDAFNHLGDLAVTARRCAGEIRVPSRIYLSEKDRVADSGMTISLFEGLDHVEMIRVDKADHILLYDHGADRIIRDICDFFRQTDK